MPEQKTQRKAVAAKTARPRKSGATVVEPAATDTPAQPTRRPNEKVRARMRSRLMTAARAVMSRKGIEGTAINDITDEAQVAFGSFYNYFSSKEEVARAIFVEDVTAVADMLDRNRPTEEDIVLITGFNIQWTLRHAITDPIWGWFLIHTASSVGDLMEDMLERLARDIRTGVKSGQFCPDQRRQHPGRCITHPSAGTGRAPPRYGYRPVRCFRAARPRRQPGRSGPRRESVAQIEREVTAHPV
jgi:AcrR family transcriptional regulator